MTNLFRIGGFYRQVNGVISEVTRHGERGGYLYVTTVWAPEGKRHHGGGARNASDGRYSLWAKDDHDEYTLLPGELQKVDGQWVPVEEEKPQTIQAYEDFVRQHWLTHVAEGSVAKPIPHYHQGAPVRIGMDWAEKTRPALDWATATPFDPFQGYQVTRSTNEQQACKSPLTTLGDGTDPAHASAYLKF